MPPFKVEKSRAFDAWLTGLKDRVAVFAVLRRADRLALGQLGDHKSVGGGVTELRIDHGPGYRMYMTQRGNTTYLLLCGGDKSTQRADIRRAIAMAQELT